MATRPDPEQTTQWQFVPTLSGSRKGFAQAVSYEAMTEFARRFPSFGLSQSIYQSSNEAGLPTSKRRRSSGRGTSASDSRNLLSGPLRDGRGRDREDRAEHPGFYVRVHAVATGASTSTRALTPSRIPSRPRPHNRTHDRGASLLRVDRRAEHLRLRGSSAARSGSRRSTAPRPRTTIFNLYTSSTRPSRTGRTPATSETERAAGTSTLNGSVGIGHADRERRGGRLAGPLGSPHGQPTPYNGFRAGGGPHDPGHEPSVAGGDASRFVTGVAFLRPLSTPRPGSPRTSTSSDSGTASIGAPVRNGAGVFRGIVGAKGGTISLRSPRLSGRARRAVVNGVFQATPEWASRPKRRGGHRGRRSGIVYVTYVDEAGKTCTDERVIGYGQRARRRGVSLRRLPVERRLDERPAARARSAPAGTTGPAASAFHTLTPCRVFDSRRPRPRRGGAPALAPARRTSSRSRAGAASRRRPSPSPRT